VTDDERLEESKQQALALIAARTVDGLPLAEQLLKNEWFLTLADFAKLIGDLRSEAAKTSGKADEQAILVALGRVRKLLPFA
jgi:hypothetical protein